MKSCLTTLLVVVTLAAMIGCGALIWYLSDTAQFSRKLPPPAARALPAAPPAARALPAVPPAARALPAAPPAARALPAVPPAVPPAAIPRAQPVR